MNGIQLSISGRYYARERGREEEEEWASRKEGGSDGRKEGSVAWEMEIFQSEKEIRFAVHVPHPPRFAHLPTAAIRPTGLSPSM